MAPQRSAIRQYRSAWCSGRMRFFFGGGMIWLRRESREWPLNPTLRGMPASHTSSAERNEFGKSTATSNRPRNFRATEKIDSPLSMEITSSTSGTRSQSPDSLAGARMASRASGRPSLNARAACRLITASPSQFDERTTMRNGLRACSPAGRKTPRLAVAVRKFGQGTFQRLLTQNQSGGETRIWRSRATLMSKVSFSGLSACQGISSLRTTRHFANPAV